MVSCLENPRVGGSIPPQATKYGNPATSTVAGFFIKICGISSVGRAIPCQGIGREFEPLIPLQMHKRPQKPVLVMGFCVSGNEGAALGRRVRVGFGGGQACCPERSTFHSCFVGKVLGSKFFNGHSSASMNPSVAVRAQYREVFEGDF